MAEYRIWGRIEEIRPQEYLAIACAVREDSANAPISTRALTDVLPSKAAAQQRLRELVRNLGETIVLMGARVTDVETDDI